MVAPTTPTTPSTPTTPTTPTTPSTPTTPTTPAAPSIIGVGEAKSIALDAAGVSSGSAVFSKAKLERDDGRQIYDIEFYVAGVAEYEYEIDALTGDIIDASTERWERDDDYDD